MLAPACLSTDHPGYLSFIPSAPSKAAIAFDLVVSASAIYGGSWVEGAGAVFAENEVLHWLAREFGLPATAGGVFVQGGTIGNLSALVTARDAARRRNRENGVADPARWVVLCSAEAHSSIASAAAVMDIDVVAAAPDAGGRLRGEAVARALDEHGAAVFAVVATGGTTNFGIVDHIASIAEVTRSRGVWLHIDGAYGLAAMLVERMRPTFAGVEHADSVIVDPHKWLFAPFDVCALLYRDPDQARLAHTQKAEYLDTLTESADWNPSDLGVQLTRRSRGLPLWFSLAAHGTEQYRSAIDHGITLARTVADEIAERPHLSLVREPELSVVVFRREGWSAARLPGVVRPAARRAEGLRGAQLARGRARAALRDHQPAHDDRAADLDPRHPRLTTRRARTRARTPEQRSRHPVDERPGDRPSIDSTERISSSVRSRGCCHPTRECALSPSIIPSTCPAMAIGSSHRNSPARRPSASRPARKDRQRSICSRTLSARRDCGRRAPSSAPRSASRRRGPRRACCRAPSTSAAECPSWAPATCCSSVSSAPTIAAKVSATRSFMLGA